ncbi:GIY-YIG nuclease family protein [Candidatus Thioglobus sp.]|jgi:hypothetical protein|nr:GIY-YIG nuclease family protein [Candidatus Thioglobus sp.]
MIGFIYVMSNPAHPGLVKIGQTSKDPELRRRDLSTTGVLEDFVLEYRVLTEDYDEIELEVHRQLIDSRYRQDREFFEISPSEAISKIREVAGERVESEKNFSKFVSAAESQSGDVIWVLGIILAIFVSINLFNVLGPVIAGLLFWVLIAGILIYRRKKNKSLNVKYFSSSVSKPSFKKDLFKILGFCIVMFTLMVLINM